MDREQPRDCWQPKAPRVGNGPDLEVGVLLGSRSAGQGWQSWI